MTSTNDRLHVNLGASQLRKRLKGHGFGVKRIETAGKNQAVIVHSATGRHLEELRALLSDVIDEQPGSAEGENTLNQTAP